MTLNEAFEPQACRVPMKKRMQEVFDFMDGYGIPPERVDWEVLQAMCVLAHQMEMRGAYYQGAYAPPCDPE